MGITLDAFQHLLDEIAGLDLGSLHIECRTMARERSCEKPARPSRGESLLPLHEGELQQLLAHAIEELRENEQQVLALYYYEELTMKEAGAVLGVGESRVSQIHSLAVPACGPSSPSHLRMAAVVK